MLEWKLKLRGRLYREDGDGGEGNGGSSSNGDGIGGTAAGRSNATSAMGALGMGGVSRGYGGFGADNNSDSGSGGMSSEARAALGFANSLQDSAVRGLTSSERALMAMGLDPETAVKYGTLFGVARTLANVHPLGRLANMAISGVDAAANKDFGALADLGASALGVQGPARTAISSLAYGVTGNPEAAASNMARGLLGQFGGFMGGELGKSPAAASLGSLLGRQLGSKIAARGLGSSGISGSVGTGLGRSGGGSIYG